MSITSCTLAPAAVSRGIYCENTGLLRTGLLPRWSFVSIFDAIRIRAMICIAITAERLVLARQYSQIRLLAASYRGSSCSRFVFVGVIRV